MEVLSSLAGFDITIDSPNGELEKLTEQGLAGEILTVDNNPPYNHSSGKTLFLKIRKNQRSSILINYIPVDADWSQLKYIRVMINQTAYDKLYSKGRIAFESPEIPESMASLIIQDKNATCSS